jgi:hypothetical protein
MEDGGWRMEDGGWRTEVQRLFEATGGKPRFPFSRANDPQELFFRYPNNDIYHCHFVTLVMQLLHNSPLIFLEELLVTHRLLERMMTVYKDLWYVPFFPEIPKSFFFYLFFLSSPRLFSQNLFLKPLAYPLYRQKPASQHGGVFGHITKIAVALVETAQATPELKILFSSVTGFEEFAFSPGGPVQTVYNKEFVSETEKPQRDPNAAPLKADELPDDDKDEDEDDDGM